MLEKIKTTVTVEARKETDNALYQLNYSVVDNNLTSVNCSVNKKTVVQVDAPDGQQFAEQQVYAGNVYLTNGHITCSIPQGNDASAYMADFMAMVEEIESGISAEISA